MNLNMLYSLLLSLLPSFIHVFIRRSLLRQEIGENVCLKFGSIIVSKDVNIGDNSRIGPFSFLKGENIEIGSNSVIGSLVILSSRINKIGSYVNIKFLSIIRSDSSETSKFKIGDHGMIFPFCWLDTGQGIEIGNQVGIGGHTLMFTHGVWANYLKGGPISYGPIKIGDNVWLPWRIFIMPGITIGDNVIVGGNSLINKSVESNSLIAGSPAKKIKDLKSDLSDVEKHERLLEILNAYCEKRKNTKKIEIISQGSLRVEDSVITLDINLINNENDLYLSFSEVFEDCTCSYIQFDDLKYVSKKYFNDTHKDFINFLRGYGIRLYIN